VTPSKHKHQPLFYTTIQPAAGLASRLGVKGDFNTGTTSTCNDTFMLMRRHLHKDAT